MLGGESPYHLPVVGPVSEFRVFTVLGWAVVKVSQESLSTLPSCFPERSCGFHAASPGVCENVSFPISFPVTERMPEDAQGGRTAAGPFRSQSWSWAVSGRLLGEPGQGLVSCLNGQGFGARLRERTASSGVSLDIGTVVSLEIFIRAACQSSSGLLQGQQSVQLVGWASRSRLIGPYISFRGTGNMRTLSCVALL